MTNETEHLAKTLAFILSVILDSDAQKRQRIALAYQEAEQLVAAIDNGDARPRIEACVKRFDRYKVAGDVACAGWMLKAVQERVEERNLRGWRKLQKVIDQASKLLLLAAPTRH